MTDEEDKQKKHLAKIEQRFKQLVESKIGDEHPKSWTLIVTIIIVVLIAAAAGGVYWKKKDDWFAGTSSKPTTRTVAAPGRSGTRITINSSN